MAGQGIERREILRYIGIASVASTFPGFRQWTFACSLTEHAEAHAAPQASSQPYKPLFFSAEQYRLLERLTEIIIPADDSPGAKEAGVAEFIDFMLANRVAITANDGARSVEERLRQGSAAQVQFVAGLNWLDVRANPNIRALFWTALLRSRPLCSKNSPTSPNLRPSQSAAANFFRCCVITP